LIEEGKQERETADAEAGDEAADDGGAEGADGEESEAQ
jgi:hypothetical protein